MTYSFPLHPLSAPPRPREIPMAPARLDKQSISRAPSLAASQSTPLTAHARDADAARRARRQRTTGRGPPDCSEGPGGPCGGARHTRSRCSVCPHPTRLTFTFLRPSPRRRRLPEEARWRRAKGASEHRTMGGWALAWRHRHDGGMRQISLAFDVVQRTHQCAPALARACLSRTTTGAVVCLAHFTTH